MASEIVIVEVVEFVSTDQCLADPSLFQAVRDVVQAWQERGLKGQYWSTSVERPNNMYWVLFWESRAHAAAFAADPSYPEFIQRRQSLAAAPVRDFHVPLSGTPQLYVDAPITEIDYIKTDDTRIEETHEVARGLIQHVRSLQPPGFIGSGYGIADEDPTVGVYFAGWNAVEDHMRLGMEEGHEKFKDGAEELMRQLKDLTIAHMALKKHGA